MRSNSLIVDTVILDVDGTLLNSQHQMTPRTLAALERTMAAGVMVLLATGKSYQATKAIREALNIVTPGIYVQGAIVHESDGRVRAEQFLPPDLVAEAEQVGQRAGLTLVAYSGQYLFTPQVSAASDRMVAYHEPRPAAITNFSKITVHKLQFIGQQTILDQVRSETTAAFLPQATFTQAVPEILELIPANSSKGTAAAGLLADLGRSPQRALAIGDGENDIDLLELVAIGVAMGNAADFVKARADYITADNDHDGVAAALERFVLPAS